MAGARRQRRRALTAVATEPKAGFETAIPVARGYKAFQVQALDAGGRVIGTSPSFTPTG